jgi:hypothetical protein
MKLWKSTFEVAPKGTHRARTTTRPDLGLQEHNWSGSSRQARRLAVIFELALMRTKDGHPFLRSSIRSPFPLSAPF